jgi:dsDNA-specific endonuclease/ATPase MutS2
LRGCLTTTCASRLKPRSISTPSRRDIRSVVDAYIDAASEAGLTEVRVVHGRGRGVQRGLVQATLERHPRVVEFWDDTASHLGATMVLLSRGGPAR